MHADQLAALVAVVDEGSFEAAARALHVTPPAISQRIKALERHHGRVLVVRSSPCRATADGEVLLRLARQVAELEADAVSALTPGTVHRRRLPLVVNADSLATWFVPVLAEAATWPDVMLELLIEVEDHGTQHLRTGAAVGAITSDPVVVSGCTIEPLGVLRYVPVCTPQLRERHASTQVDWARLPMVRFSDEDELQHRLLRRHGVEGAEIQHLIPENHAFLAAVRAGLGWGLISEPQLGDLLDTGELVRIGRNDDHVDVHLAWQSWRLPSRATTRLGEAIHRAARNGLRPPPRPSS